MALLNLTIINTFDLAKIGFRDSSEYTSTPSNPNLVIVPPALFPISVPFVPYSDNVYSVSDLDIDCTDGSLPDGLYTIKYSIQPNIETEVTQYFYRTSALYCKYQEALLSYNSRCSGYSTDNLQQILSVRILLESIQAATRNCDYTTANKLYNTASKVIDSLSKCNC